MLAYQSQAEIEFSLESLHCVAQAVSLPKVKFDLLLYIGLNTEGELAGIFEYDADLFDQQTLALWSQCFEHFVSGLLAAPAAPLNPPPCSTIWLIVLKLKF